VGDTDIDLLAASRLNAFDGLERLVDRYSARAYRLAWRITGHADDAEEITQSAFLTAARAIHSVAVDARAAGRRGAGTPPAGARLLTDESAFGSWIYGTVARAAAERRRRRQPGVETVLNAVVEALPGSGRHFDPMQDWSTRIEEPAQRSGLEAIVSKAIDALPADYRTALVLHDVEGISRSDIADILDDDVLVVKARVHRARLFVRHRLSEYFEAVRTSTDEANKTSEN